LRRRPKLHRLRSKNAARLFIERWMKEGGGLAENMAAEIGAWGYGERRLIEDASDSE
jgi:hypothetical protein